MCILQCKHPVIKSEHTFCAHTAIFSVASQIHLLSKHITSHLTSLHCQHKRHRAKEHWEEPSQRYKTQTVETYRSYSTHNWLDSTDCRINIYSILCSIFCNSCNRKYTFSPSMAIHGPLGWGLVKEARKTTFSSIANWHTFNGLECYDNIHLHSQRRP